MSAIKVHYYKASGRAEQIRLALALAGKSFSDVNPGEEGVPAFLANCAAKGGNLTTNVPLLEVDGRFYPQSQAALQFIGRKFGLGAGEEPDKAYRLDKLIADAEDLRTVGYKCLHLPGNGLLTTKAAVDSLMTDKIPKHLANLERQLGTADFFGGSKPDISDASIYNVLVDFFVALQPTILAEYPALQKYCDRFAAIPSVKAYLESEASKSQFRFSPAVLPPE